MLLFWFAEENKVKAFINRNYSPNKRFEKEKDGNKIGCVRSNREGVITHHKKALMC